MHELVKQEWYEQLVEECKSIVTEAVFTSRWALVEGYWLLGQRISQDNNFNRTDAYGKKIVQGLGESLGISSSTIYYALQFFDKYPRLDTVPEGKNITWNKLITKYLPEAPKQPLLPLPAGKYQVIYADPPWDYEVDLSSGATREPENSYPTLSLAALVEFGEKVKKLSHKDCTLFMWITAPKLNLLNDVLEAWGFEYKTCLVWDKVKPNLGHYSSVRHELLIIAGKGKAAPLCDGKTIQSVDSVQSIEKSPRHSEKPEAFRTIIETLYPDTKRIELFARRRCANWDAWGNDDNL